MYIMEKERVAHGVLIVFLISMMHVSKIDTRSLNPSEISTDVVLRLFPQADAKTVSKLSTKSELLVKNIWPRGPAPQEEGKEGAEGGKESGEGKEGSGNERGKGEGGKEQGDGNQNAATKPKEATISVPRFYKNKKGEWVYDQKPYSWGATFLDTRFNDGGAFRLFRFRIDKFRPVNYYRTGTLKTVCLGSTWYNELKVKNYITKFFHVYLLSTRLHYGEMRRALFKDGKSEECHNEELYGKWRTFQECLIFRNQRMEYLIPKYPLHQMGFFFDFIVGKNEVYDY